MAERPLTFPFAGRVDDAAHSAQPELTTRVAKNVRNRDPVTGRIRGGQRSGMVKFNEDAIGTGRVKALVSTAIDDRKIEYLFDASPSTSWSEATPSKLSCLDGKVDRQGNVYALDGPAGIVKFNSSGEEVLKITLPVADPGHIVRALWIDESDRIFAGVSAGGDVRTARVWCILQFPNREYGVLWTLEPGAYTEELRVFRGSQLFAGHNYPLENRSRVLIYEGIALDPREVKRIESVAYPINGMDVLDGAVYCAAQESEAGGQTVADQRPGHPSARECMAPLVAWTPYDDPTIKVWQDCDGSYIDETDVEQTGDTATLEDGQQVLRWRDRSSADRHWFAGSLFVAAERGPSYSKVGIGGLPSLRFANREIDGTTFIKNSLCTLGNASIDVSLADQQRSALPAHTGGMWAMFILFRPTPDADAVAPNPRIVFAQKNQAAAPATSHILFTGRACSNTVPGAYSAGDVSYYAVTDSGDPGQCAGADQALDSDFAADDENTGCVLMTILWDGGVEPNDTSKTRCLIRMNGKPIDRFEGLPFTSLEPSWLGMAPGASFSAAQQVTSIGELVSRRLNGEIAKVFVVQRRDRLTLTEPKVLTFDALETGDPSASETDTQIARIEAWIMYGRGLGHLLQKSSDTYPHFYGLADNGQSVFIGGPPAAGAGGLSEANSHLLLRAPLTSKHDSNGKLVWVCNEMTHPDVPEADWATDDDGGGIGYGVRARKVESDGLVHVWMMGAEARHPLTSEVGARKVIDQGATFSGLQADGAWRHRFGSNDLPDYAFARMASDKFGNIFIPGNGDGSGMATVVVLKKDPDVSGDAEVLVEMLFPSPFNAAHAIALPPDALTPDYRGDLTDEVAELAYVFTVAGDGVLESADSVFRVQLVNTSALASGSPLSIVTLALLEDDVHSITASTNVIPTGGTAAFDGTAQYVQAFRAGDDIVILDGTRYLAYSLRDATIAGLASTSAGEIPPRGQIGMFWRHRLVIGRFADAKGNYAASKLGDIRNWDLHPGVNPSGVELAFSTQAFTGTLTRAGEAEDEIVAMIPAWDDIAFIVGRSKILRLTGDPQDGGSIHLVTDSLGGVFGDSWCKDAQGRVFMWGNKPAGLYQLFPDRDPVSLTGRSLESSDFDDIDYTTHRITLAWDPIEGTVRVYQVSWASPSTIVASWAWEEEGHRLVRVPPIWQDRIGSADKQITAVSYLGGDDSQGLLYGCEDGLVRLADREADSDDGTMIDSFVMIEITPHAKADMAYRLNSITITLAADQGGARLEIFSSDTAEDIGAAVASVDLQPGRNPPFRCRVKGRHIWARIRSATVGRWAYEEGVVDIEAVGRVRSVTT